MSDNEIKKIVNELTKRMHKAAVELNFEEAAKLRDKIAKYDKKLSKK